MDIDDVMSFDVLNTAEKTGLNPFTLLQMKTAAEKECASNLNDTHYNIGWKEFIDLVGGTGHFFKFEKKFESVWKSDGKKEEEIIWWDDTNFLLLYANSYHEHLNHCTCYGNCSTERKNSHDIFPILSHCSHGTFKDLDDRTYCDWNYDGRMFLFTKLTQISMACSNSPWKLMPFVWLLNSEECKNKDYNYGLINISKLSPWFPYLDLYKRTFNDVIQKNS
jgi:hypothetical protein